MHEFDGVDFPRIPCVVDRPLTFEPAHENMVLITWATSEGSFRQEQHLACIHGICFSGFSPLEIRETKN